jgi:hypothetical protein
MQLPDDHHLVVAMAQRIQRPAQRADRAATLAVTAALARRQVLLQRRHQEAVATARAVCQALLRLVSRRHAEPPIAGWR